MDSFGTPTKVNRHVLKALDYLECSGNGFASVEEIIQRVKHQMRNTKPVRNVDDVIVHSIHVLASLCLVKKVGEKYALPQVSELQDGNTRLATSKSYVPVFVPGSPVPQRSAHTLHPLLKRSSGRLDPEKGPTKWLSDDSLSGNEQEKAIKRYRFNHKRLVKEKINPVPLSKDYSLYKAPPGHTMVCGNCRTAASAFEHYQSNPTDSLPDVRRCPKCLDLRLN